MNSLQDWLNYATAAEMLSGLLGIPCTFNQNNNGARYLKMPAFSHFLSMSEQKRTGKSGLHPSPNLKYEMHFLNATMAYWIAGVVLFSAKKP